MKGSTTYGPFITYASIILDHLGRNDLFATLSTFPSQLVPKPGPWLLPFKLTNRQPGREVMDLLWTCLVAVEPILMGPDGA
jgi:hypothetical protein